jgi:hypothetical protein
MRGSMHPGHRHGLDYTPLYRFLLSRVGQDWNTVHSEAVSRLDRSDPIFHIVAKHVDDKRRFVRTGESSYFSGLFIDDANQLAFVDPNLTADDMEPFCSCCTHTFNGKPFGKPFVQR